MSAPVRMFPAPAPAATGRPDARWLSLRVELVCGGPVGALWPPPGRYLAALPGHTFADLAAAIDTAFGRWDLRRRPPGRLRAFDLASGWHVRDRGDTPATGATAAVVDISHPLGDLLDAGAEFSYTFDVDGGCWRHDCVVTAEDTDPVEVLGGEPDRPVPYYGWGVIPDQHGRFWLDVTDTAPPPPEHLEKHIHAADAVITVAERRAMIIQSRWR